MVDVLSTELQKSSLDDPHPFKEDLDNAMEQCFYCMYGHPNKRAKAKHLQDHNAEQVRVT